MQARGVLALNFLADALVSCLPTRGKQAVEKESVLLVRLDAIGDFVLWLDAAGALRALYPPERYRMVLIGNELWCELARLQPFFDEVIPVNTARLSMDLGYRIGIWRLLRSQRWTVALNPTFSRHFPCDDAAIRVCGAEERIGFESDASNQRPWELAVSNRWYTRRIPAGSARMMELERNAHFVRSLGAAGFRAGLPKLRLAEHPLVDIGGEYFVVVPGASLSIKRWPVENFAELARRIVDRYGLKPVICGAPDEWALAEHLERILASFSIKADNRCGSTSLTGFAQLIRGASFVVGNDSSAIHIAAAVGTRSFCLAGGGHYGRFVPYRMETAAPSAPVVLSHPLDCYQCNLHCPYAAVDDAAPCMKEIAVDELWTRLDSVFAPRCR